MMTCSYSRYHSTSSLVANFPSIFDHQSPARIHQTKQSFPSYHMQFSRGNLIILLTINNRGASLLLIVSKHPAQVNSLECFPYCSQCAVKCSQQSLGQSINLFRSSTRYPAGHVRSSNVTRSPTASILRVRSHCVQYHIPRLLRRLWRPQGKVSCERCVFMFHRPSSPAVPRTRLMCVVNEVEQQMFTLP